MRLLLRQKKKLRKTRKMFSRSRRSPKLWIQKFKSQQRPSMQLKRLKRKIVTFTLEDLRPSKSFRSNPIASLLSGRRYRSTRAVKTFHSLNLAAIGTKFRPVIHRKLCQRRRLKREAS